MVSGFAVLSVAREAEVGAVVAGAVVSLLSSYEEDGVSL